MASDTIFLKLGDELVELVQTPYELESEFQHLLAVQPELLAGAQIDPDDPRRWLLVRREVGVPAHEGGGTRWSLDHLFIDQDAVPSLVEVKRSSDTRLRREVVAQMLDYAANGARYWAIEELRGGFERSCSEAGASPETVLEEFLESDRGYESFWGQVEENLRTGHIRLMFVADQIPLELQTIVEFLNEQMSTAEVIAIEIRQYVGSGQQVLVPRVVGWTATAQRRRQSAASGSFEELLDAALPDTREVEQRLVALAGQFDLDCTTTQTARKIASAATGTLALLYPQWDMVEFYISGLWEFDEARTRSLHEWLSSVEGKELPKKHPGPKTSTLLRNWDTFATKFFPAYVDMRRSIRQTTAQ